MPPVETLVVTKTRNHSTLPATIAAVGLVIGVMTAILTAGAVSAAPPAHAKSMNAQIEVDLDWSCELITVVSDKDISNIVVRIDGVDTKIEFRDGVNSYEFSAAGVTDVWVKAGKNKSGDGPGYGQHFETICYDVIFGWNS